MNAGWFESESGAVHLKWLRLLARHGGPHLQRILRIMKGRVIYEAVLGPPVTGKLDEAARARLLSTLKPLHDTGAAHGAVASSLVVDEGGPTLLVAGRAPTAASPEDDLRALAAL